MIAAIDHDTNGSVLVADGKNNIKVWVDIYADGNGDLEAEFNQYIFRTDDENDIEMKKWQEENWENAFDLAREYAVNRGLVEELPDGTYIEPVYEDQQKTTAGGNIYWCNCCRIFKPQKLESVSKFTLTGTTFGHFKCGAGCYNTLRRKNDKTV